MDLDDGVAATADGHGSSAAAATQSGTRFDATRGGDVAVLLWCDGTGRRGRGGTGQMGRVAPMQDTVGPDLQSRADPLDDLGIRASGFFFFKIWRAFFY